ncbi:MAG TPA: amidase [Candidatus Sulfopaludibacter sp.]|jgi:aspartyl-tRNA(Asn)/glutamyl-tRNA(Gln) amidotransferase subunit A|nr:amidase [Candidatus Sulfopaludibacter sp.]
MADLGNDIFFATIPELNRRLVAREISAVELAHAFATRLEQQGPRYNALALPLPQQALKQAKLVDQDLKRGRTRGPLQAIPYAVKDLLAYAGSPTTWGAKPYAGQVFNYNATVIDKLGGVGAVLTGKLSMVELAGGGGYRTAAASLFGPGLNPWDRSYWSGGSSSGSAAAVAAGLVPFAIGSETSGSIVTPASYCGVTALRPTYGLVSRHGAMALSWTLDKLGPFARSAEDCGLILQVIAGKDSNDPGSAGRGFYYTPQYARPLKDLKIGYAAVDFNERAEGSARPAFQAALEVVKQCGAQLVEVKLPQFPYGAALSTILAAEQASIFEQFITSGKVDQLADPMQIAGLKASLDVPARDYLKAMRLRRLMQQAISQLFSEVDALVTPGRPGPATKIDQPLDRPAPGSPQQPEGTPPGFQGIIQAGNLAGLPALVLPCGMAGNLPVALQVVGAPFSENVLLAIGKDFQTRTDWHKRHPGI